MCMYGSDKRGRICVLIFIGQLIPDSTLSLQFRTGITFGNYWHNFRVKDVNVRNELPESLITNHKQTVYYYAQPSMGVVVCPATFAENGTRIVNDDCYYVYKWVGSWKRDPETIDKRSVDVIFDPFDAFYFTLLTERFSL